MTAQDANDILCEYGPDELRRRLLPTQSVPAKLTWSKPGLAERPAQVEDEIERLALLSPFDYERVRNEDAKRLNVRTSVLDDRVVKHRKANERGESRQAGFLEPLVPWPTQVECAALLTELVQAITRYVKVPVYAAEAIAFWIIHAHAIDCTEIAPILAIESPEKRCGKTTLLLLIQALVPKPLTAANMSPAVVYRAVEQFGPTLIIDEADTFVTSDKAELIGILNSSHLRSSAYVLRIVGDNYEVKEFSTWCAKAIALIGKLPGTLQDRSISIGMWRKKKDETVERLRVDRLTTLHELRSKAARWVVDHKDTLSSIDPKVPAELNDRAADNWRPLLAIAEIAGGMWPEVARAAAIALSGASQDDDLSKGVMLIRDCRRVFDETRLPQLSAEALVSKLCALDEAPWKEWRHSEKPITSRGVAMLLKPFKISSKHSSAAREYHRADFEDAFMSYLSPSTTNLSVASVNPLENSENYGGSSVAADLSLTDRNPKNDKRNNSMTLMTLENRTSDELREDVKR